MDLGTRIQTLRKQQGLSQEELADRLGLSRQAIGKWETGGSMPSIDNLLELSEILDTTVDYLLTGRAPAFPEDALRDDAVPQEDAPGHAAAPQTISLDALKELLSERQTVPRWKKYLRWAIMGLAAAALVASLCLLGYHSQRLDALESRFSDAQSHIARLDGQLAGIHTDTSYPAAQPDSILSAYDYGHGAYDEETDTAILRLSATPKTLTEDTRLFFVLSPMVSSEDTLAEPITVEGSGSSGAFAAEVSVPLVQDFTVSVLLEQDGFRHTEQFMTQYAFSSLYVCTIQSDAHDFTWTLSGKSLRVSGSPTVTVTPASSTTAPRPETLVGELYVDNVLVYSEVHNIYEDLYGPFPEPADETAPQQSSPLEVTYYFYPAQDTPYACSEDPHVLWRFTMTDTAGKEYVDTIEWGQ